MYPDQIQASSPQMCVYTFTTGRAVKMIRKQQQPFIIQEQTFIHMHMYDQRNQRTYHPLMYIYRIPKNIWIESSIHRSEQTYIHIRICHQREHSKLSYIYIYSKSGYPDRHKNTIIEDNIYIHLSACIQIIQRSSPQVCVYICIVAKASKMIRRQHQHSSFKSKLTYICTCMTRGSRRLIIHLCIWIHNSKEHLDTQRSCIYIHKLMYSERTQGSSSTSVCVSVCSKSNKKETQQRLHINEKSIERVSSQERQRDKRTT